MSLFRKSLGLWCKIVGHKWRRLRKAERPISLESGETFTATHERICDRCGIYRPVKQRKAK